jgi:precorrin-2 dehydrogenase/sirohydrochlorin ferrochelatase
MKYYPVYLNVRELPCVVVGGGPVAERKTLSLLEAGANVTVVSPALTAKLQELSGSGKIRYLRKPFEEKDLSGAFVVVAATDSPEINSAVGRLCRGKNILVNVAAPPEESSFIVPSVVERGDLVIAVSTGGASPSLSRKVRQELEGKFGPEYEVFLKRLAVVRKRLIEEVPDETRRRLALQAIVESDIIDLLKQNRTQEADRRIGEIAGLKPR